MGGHIMRISILFLVFLVFSGLNLRARNAPQTFDKSRFYRVMASGKVDDINNEIAVVSSSETSYKEGYEGALLMRKAGLLKIPAEKLKYFKRGRTKLETALLNDNDNAEYHFLRLTIQEHAPKIVKYHDELETDKEYIKKSFKNLPPVVQQAIINYSASSKVLNPQDL
jgi:hypothetical protein